MQPLLAGPPHGRQELIDPGQLPVGEKQLGIWSDGMNDLAAEDAVLAILGLQVAVVAEGTHVDPGRQGLAQMIAPAAKAGIEDGDLDPLAPVTQLVPAVRAQLGHVCPLLHQARCQGYRLVRPILFCRRGPD